MDTLRTVSRVPLTALLGLSLAAGCAPETDPRQAQAGTAGAEGQMRYETPPQHDPRGATAHMEQGPPGDLMLGPDGVEHSYDGIMPHDRMGASPGDAGSTSDEQRARALGLVCPMLTARTELRVEDLDQGVALVFTTRAQEDVETLRAHVEHLASLPVWAQADGTLEQERGMQDPQGMLPGPSGTTDPTMSLPAALATAQPVPGGARLELRAESPREVDELRAGARLRAERLRTTECPMMHAAASR